MKNKRLILLISAVLVISTLLKLYLARIFSCHICGDTAITALMAKQILRGDFPLFFYNGYYTIPVESLAISVFFFLFGISSYNMFLGPVFVSVLFSISTFFLGRELKDNKTGLMALVFTAFPPYYLFKYGTSPIGYLIELILLGNLIIYFTWKICGGREKYFYFVLLGVFGGLAFWTHYISLYYLVPSFIFITISLLAVKRFRYYICGGMIGLTSFFIIGLPWWHFCITNDFICFRFPGMSLPVDKFFLLKRFIFYQIPGILALYMSKLDFFKTINIVIYTISFIFFFLPRDKKNKNWLFLLIFASMLILFCRGGAFATMGDHRYVFPVYSIMPCMLAYFLEWMDSKKRYLGTGILLYLVLSNSLYIARGISIDKVECSKNGDVHNQLMDFFAENNITGVYGRIGDLNTINFLGKDRIFAAQLFDSDAPFDGGAQAADRIAFLDDDWITIALDRLCQSYEKTTIGPHNIFYNLKPMEYCGEEIPPDGWKAQTNYNQAWARFAFDRDLDRYWSSIDSKKKGMYFQIEFPRIYKIYKFQVFNLPEDELHFPQDYKIFVSKDGKDWSLIDECKMAYPMFWSGPRLTWRMVDTRWEVIFKPVDVRFIRIEQDGDSRYPWQINEIIFYEYKGDRNFKVRDYVKDAKDVYCFLKTEGINFIYADYWLSEKIRIWSGGKIGTLGIYNSFFKKRKNLSRLMELDAKRAVVIEKADSHSAERIFAEYELPYRKRVFGRYIVYYSLNNRGNLYWIGAGIAKINKAGFGVFLADYAKLSGDDNYYLKAVKYSPADYNLRRKVLQIYKERGEGRLYKKEALFIKNRLTPDIRRETDFQYGIKFLGMSIKLITDGRYRLDYFWKLEKYPQFKTFVFVHFIKDGKIIFQNDHPLLESYVRLPVAPHNDIWKESYFIKFPQTAAADECGIRLGIFVPKTGRRLRIKGSRETFVEIFV